MIGTRNFPKVVTLQYHVQEDTGQGHQGYGWQDIATFISRDDAMTYAKAQSESKNRNALRVTTHTLVTGEHSAVLVTYSRNR